MRRTKRGDITIKEMQRPNQPSKWRTDRNVKKNCTNREDRKLLVDLLKYLIYYLNTVVWESLVETVRLVPKSVLIISQWLCFSSNSNLCAWFFGKNLHDTVLSLALLAGYMWFLFVPPNIKWAGRKMFCRHSKSKKRVESGVAMESKRTNRKFV